jgi:TRAP-type C4-dicarboxylate transport system permease small subunit
VTKPHAQPGAIDTDPVSILHGREDQAAALHLDSAPSDNVIVARVQQIKPLVSHSVEDIIAASAMLCLVAITLANVVARYVINFSFAFTEEYSSVILFIVVFVMTSSAIVRNSHIKMTFFTDMMPPKYQKLTEIIGSIAMIVCFVILIYYGSVMTLDAYRFEETSPGLGNPTWIYLIWVPLLSLVAMFRALGLLVRILSVSAD